MFFDSDRIVLIVALTPKIVLEFRKCVGPSVLASMTIPLGRFLSVCVALITALALRAMSMRWRGRVVTAVWISVWLLLARRRSLPCTSVTMLKVKVMLTVLRTLLTRGVLIRNLDPLLKQTPLTALLAVMTSK